MKELIIVLGRSEELEFELDSKLPFSYLDFFKEIRKKKHLYLKLKNYLRRPIDSNNCQEYPIFILKESVLQSIYFIDTPVTFPYFKGLKTELLACILNTLNKLDLLDYAQDKIYYLCHDNHFDEPTLTEKRIESDEKKDVISKINDLLNIEISINRFCIATFYHEKDKSKIFTALKAANVNNWKDFDIKTLLKKFDSDLLEGLKKKLIDTFLPLAIDVQGLSEIAEYKRADYLADVLNDLEQNAETLIKDWQKINETLFSERDDISLVKKFKFTEEEIKKLRFPIEELTNETLEDFIRENYKNPQSDMFLPYWLQSAIQIIDDKLLKA